MPSLVLSAPRRILVVRYRFIGDTLLTVPFLQALRQRYPHAEIDVLAGPNSGELLQHCPYINQVLLFDTTRKHRYETVADQPPASWWRWVRQLRASGYDRAYLLKRSLSSAWLVWLAGIPQRIGFDTEARRWLLTHPHPYPTSGHETDAFLSLLNGDDPNPCPVDPPRVWLTPNEETEAAAAMAPFAGHYNVGLHITASNPAKLWPTAHWLQLLLGWLPLLQQRHPDRPLTIHAFGAASDRSAYEPLQHQVQAVLPMVNWQLWCGHTSLRQTQAQLVHLTGMVGVDSGTLHMAAAAGLPVVVVFGPMDAERWQPMGPKVRVVEQGLACQPCHLKVACAYDLACLKDLRPDTVERACLETLP